MRISARSADEDDGIRLKGLKRVNSFIEPAYRC
jgi:hypothetical protein